MPNKKLQELAQIAQIQGALSAPSQEAVAQQQRAQQNDLATALQVLNLQQQQQQQVAAQQLQQQQLAQSASQFDRQQESFGDRNFNEGVQMFGATQDPVARKAVADRYPGINDAQRGLDQQQNEIKLQTLLPMLKAAQGKPEIMSQLQGSFPPELWAMAQAQIPQQAPATPQPAAPIVPTAPPMFNSQEQQETQRLREGAGAVGNSIWKVLEALGLGLSQVKG